MIIELTSNNFKNAIKKGIKVVEFYMPDCPYCVKQNRVLEEFDNIWIGRVSSSCSKDLIAEYDIFTFPTFVIFNNGVELTRFSGFRTKEDLIDKFIKNIPK